MKRDMELIRLILLKIEDEYISQNILGLTIEGYDMEQVAYHCKMLYEAGLVSYYEGLYTFSGLEDFQVGPITWMGHDFLDTIRDNGIWDKTKNTIKKKGLPMLVDTIKAIANAFINAAVEGTVTAIMKNGGV